MPSVADQSPGSVHRLLAGRFLLLAPVTLFLAVVFFGPLAKLLQMSFQGDDGPLSAYAQIAANEVYRRVFLNTLQLSLTVALITVLLSYPTAYMLSRLKGWKLSIAFWCLLFPLWISVLVRTFSWILLLEQNGPVNRALQASGVASGPVPLLFNTVGVHIGMVHVLLPYALLPIYTSMRAVDERLLLASDALGASPFTTFRRVYLPLTLPGVVTGFILVFLLGLGFFITPALLGGIRNMTVSMLIDLFVTEQLVWPLAAAACFWLLALIVILVALASRFVNVVGTMAAR